MIGPYKWNNGERFDRFWIVITWIIVITGPATLMTLACMALDGRV